MAGIGVKLNNIFSRESLISRLYGVVYSSIQTVAPMVVVIANVLLMQLFLGFSKVPYLDREIYSCTVLYTFIFALLTCSPFNAVLSKFIADAIFEERVGDIRACLYLGLFINMILTACLGIPFCLWEYYVGQVELFYVFTGYCGYVALAMSFYTMLYLSFCKKYGRISLFFTIGMAVSFILSMVLVYIFGVEVTRAMLISLAVGFWLIASMELAQVRAYFPTNSNRYLAVLKYFGVYWKHIAANFLYTLGLYIHNFVFWTAKSRMVIVNTFVCNQTYDMASCIAMFTSISATVIFISRVEMYFRDRYKAYSDMSVGGVGADIRVAKNRMFRQLGQELMTLTRLQFIISVIVFLGMMLILPRFGFSGAVMRIYPCLAAGFFVLFIMYSAIIFLYYLDDLTGSVLTTLSFTSVTLAGSIFSMSLPETWYGLGLLLGAMTGWTVAFWRLRYSEKNWDEHIFCRGDLLKHATGKRPSSKVFDRAAQMNRGAGRKKTDSRKAGA